MEGVNSLMWKKEVLITILRIKNFKVALNEVKVHVPGIYTEELNIFPKILGLVSTFNLKSKKRHNQTDSNTENIK